MDFLLILILQSILNSPIMIYKLRRGTTFLLSYGRGCWTDHMNVIIPSNLERLRWLDNWRFAPCLAHYLQHGKFFQRAMLFVIWSFSIFNLYRSVVMLTCLLQQMSIISACRRVVANCHSWRSIDQTKLLVGRSNQAHLYFIRTFRLVIETWRYVLFVTFNLTKSIPLWYFKQQFWPLFVGLAGCILPFSLSLKWTLIAPSWLQHPSDC